MSDEEFQRLILGPRYAVRLGDLEEGHLIRLTCFRCQHSSTVMPTALLRRWAPYTTIMSLEERMVCRQCGNRLENKWEVVRRTGKEEDDQMVLVSRERETHRSPFIGSEGKPPVGGRAGGRAG